MGPLLGVRVARNHDAAGWREHKALGRGQARKEHEAETAIVAPPRHDGRPAARLSWGSCT